MVATNPYHPGWRPPFCPNPNCKYHRGLHDDWPYKRAGHYMRRSVPHRIPRFLCRHCRRSFSCQTFRADYWLKRPDILPRLLTKTCGCMANRQIARDLGVAPATVDRQLGRLGRHCLLFHQRHVRTLPPAVDISIDGFESFELSQYFPFQHHVAVDNRTGMFLWFTDSPLRRKGRRTAHQRRRRADLERLWGRPDPQAVRKDTLELLQVVAGGAPQVKVRGDDHHAYRHAIAALPSVGAWVITSSKQRRDRWNPLWEINLLDLLIRHSSSNHKRETLAWSKRRQASAWRLAVFLVWRNYVKYRWEKRCVRTPAMEAGLRRDRLTIEELLRARLFPSRVVPEGRWAEYYWGQIKTPALGVNRTHALIYAA